MNESNGIGKADAAHRAWDEKVTHQCKRPPGQRGDLLQYSKRNTPMITSSGLFDQPGDVPSSDQPGTYGQQLAALDLYGSLPWFIVNTLPDDAWQYAREQFIPHAKGAK